MSLNPWSGTGRRWSWFRFWRSDVEVSPDYKTITFHLRKGKLFHNGREMVADDVKYSIERILDPKTENPRQDILQNIVPIEVTKQACITD